MSLSFLTSFKRGLLKLEQTLCELHRVIAGESPLNSQMLFKKLNVSDSSSKS